MTGKYDNWEHNQYYIYTEKLKKKKIWFNIQSRFVLENVGKLNICMGRICYGHVIQSNKMWPSPNKKKKN